MENQNKRTLKKAIFIHIPKVGGSTLHTIMREQYGKKGLLPVFYAEDPSLEAFTKLPPGRQKSIKALIGHIPFGLVAPLGDEFSFFTLLRDPIDRVPSFYSYVIRHPEHHLYQTITSNNWSLEDCFQNKASVELDNWQVRLLCGPAPYSITFGQCNDVMLQAAKDNLKTRFAVTGTLDKFDETIVLLKRVLGWKLPFYSKQNVDPEKGQQRNVSSEAIELIKAHNRFDIELYDYANCLLKTQIEEQGWTFDLEVRVFRFLNFATRKSSLLKRAIS